MHDKVQTTIACNDVSVIPMKMPVWALLGQKKLCFENIFKYIAGFNKNISAEYHPTVLFHHLKYMTF